MKKDLIADRLKDQEKVLFKCRASSDIVGKKYDLAITDSRILAVSKLMWQTDAIILSRDKIVSSQVKQLNLGKAAVIFSTEGKEMQFYCQKDDALQIEKFLT